MKRRVIRHYGKSLVLEQLQETRDAIYKSIRNKLEGLPRHELEFVLETIRTSGWDAASFKSTAKQAMNQHQPALQAFLFNQEHVLDELAVSQGVFTHFHDTASDPNFAIRFPAETELIFRRVSPGDVYMLQASQHLHMFLGPNDKPSEEIPNYWEMLWTQLMQLNFQGEDFVAEALLSDSIAAFFVCQEFARRANLTYMTTLNGWGFEDEDADREFHRAFHSAQSPRYLGILCESSRTRLVDRFITRRVLTYAESEDHLWKACVLFVCFGIDMHVRAKAERDEPIRFGQSHFSFFSYASAGLYRSIKDNCVDNRNVNQEANQPAPSDPSEPGVV